MYTNKTKLVSGFYIDEDKSCFHNKQITLFLLSLNFFTLTIVWSTLLLLYAAS